MEKANSPKQLSPKKNDRSPTFASKKKEPLTLSNKNEAKQCFTTQSDSINETATHAHQTARKSPTNIHSTLRNKSPIIPKCINHRSHLSSKKLLLYRSLSPQKLISYPTDDIIHPIHLEPTSSIADYQIIRVIGVGCYGTVKLAKRKSDNSAVAIKVIDKDYVVKMGQEYCAIIEKSILMEVSHHYIIKCYECFQDKCSLYFVNEYLPGGTIMMAVKYLKYSLDCIEFYSAEVVSALSYLHSNKIIYRDLKPDNTLISKDGHVKLIDFGFSKKMSQSRTSTLCGTPAYIPPEILRGRSI